MDMNLSIDELVTIAHTPATNSKEGQRAEEARKALAKKGIVVMAPRTEKLPSQTPIPRDLYMDTHGFATMKDYNRAVEYCEAPYDYPERFKKERGLMDWNTYFANHSHERRKWYNYCALGNALCGINLKGNEGLLSICTIHGEHEDIDIEDWIELINQFNIRKVRLFVGQGYSNAGYDLDLLFKNDFRVVGAGSPHYYSGAYEDLVLQKYDRKRYDLGF